MKPVVVLCWVCRAELHGSAEVLAHACPKGEAK